MLLVFFYSTWKHQKAWDFGMFFRGRGAEETDGMKWVNTHYLDKKNSLIAPWTDESQHRQKFFSFNVTTTVNRKLPKNPAIRQSNKRG